MVIENSLQATQKEMESCNIKVTLNLTTEFMAHVAGHGWCGEKIEKRRMQFKWFKNKDNIDM